MTQEEAIRDILDSVVVAARSKRPLQPIIEQAARSILETVAPESVRATLAVGEAIMVEIVEEDGFGELNRATLEEYHYSHTVDAIEASYRLRTGKPGIPDEFTEPAAAAVSGSAE